MDCGYHYRVLAGSLYSLMSATALAGSALGCGPAVAQTASPDKQPKPSKPSKPIAAPRSPASDAASGTPSQSGATPADTTQKGADIVVTGSKAAVQRGAGKTEYDVTNSLQGATGSVADMLNTLPSVSVTSDGEVTLRGRTDVEVLIDGRPASSVKGESRGTTLQTMPGSSIKSVEVITNPSARVESGGASVINLKLKKDASLGLKASVAGNVDHRRRSRVSLNGSYGWADVKLDLDASYREDLRLDGAFSTRRYGQVAPGEIAVSTIAADYTPTRSRASDVGAKLRYTVSDRTELAGSVQHTSYVAGNIVRFLNTDYDANGTLLDRYLRVRESRLVKHDVDVDLSLKRRGIGTDGVLTLEGQYGAGTGRSDRSYRLTPQDAAVPVSLTYVGDYQDTSFYRATADFVGSLAKRLSIKTGAAWESGDERFRNGSADLPLTAPLPSQFVGTPSDFRVARDEVSGYVEATAQRTGWTLEGSLKWRGSAFDLSDGYSAPFLKRRFDGLDSSLSLSRNWSGGKLSLSLSRLQQLPDPRDFNPTVIIVDVQDRLVGNPALRPQRAIRGELAYSRSSKGLETSATLYYRGTEDTIATVYQAIADNVIQTSKINAGLSQEYGMEAGVSGKVVRGLKFDLSGNVYRAATSFNAFGTAQSDAIFTYNAKAALDWSIGTKDTLRLDARAEGPSLLVQGRRSGSRAASLVWKHTIDADVSFTLAAQQFLQNAYIVTDISSPTVATVTRRVNNTTAIQLGLKVKIK